jgi:hypothetical protein
MVCAVNYNFLVAVHYKNKKGQEWPVISHLKHQVLQWDSYCT